MLHLDHFAVANMHVQLICVGSRPCEIAVGEFFQATQTLVVVGFPWATVPVVMDQVAGDLLQTRIDRKIFSRLVILAIVVVVDAGLIVDDISVSNQMNFSN